MAAQNSPSVLENWARRSAGAPYRASTNNIVFWDFDKPMSELVAASRVCPGGRLLMAFELEAVRDYFVAGHEENGAQVEADGAKRATARRPAPALPAGPTTLEGAFELYRAADLRKDKAEEAMRDAFGEPAAALARAGDVPGAVAIIASIPNKSFANTMAISKLSDSGLWDRKDRTQSLGWVEPRPYTAHTASVLLAWQSAYQAEEIARKHMTGLLGPLVEDMVAKGDRQGLATLIERTPPCVERAFMADALRYRMTGTPAVEVDELVVQSTPPQATPGL